ncbi:MAG: hypothetical protein JWO75_4499, partial [Actinomycetia bacterium]|nr:hypothetical protein [Actinomycetes bacterium]
MTHTPSASAAADTVEVGRYHSTIELT